MEASIRAYLEEDAIALWTLFHDTVRIVNRRDYNAEQTAAWAPDEFDEAAWRARIGRLAPFVAVVDGRPVGYADVQADGSIEHFFVHHRWQRQGIGNLLMQAIHAAAKQRGAACLSCHASITAQPFFQAWGFAVIRPQTVELRGQRLLRFAMEKRLGG